MNIKDIKIGEYCERSSVKKCIFFNVCMNRLNIPKEENLFSINGYNSGFKNSITKEETNFYTCLNNSKLYKNISDVRDQLYIGSIKTDNRRKVQLEAFDTRKIFYQKNLINYFINSLNYPIYHLDFETLALPIPRFKNENPYMQSVFQFSVHVEREPGVCDIKKDNVSYLADSYFIDSREELLKKLCDTIKDDDGTIIAYHASFEKKVLKELARMFPKYEKKLNNLISRVVDLEYLFKGGAGIANDIKSMKKLQKYCLIDEQKYQFTDDALYDYKKRSRIGELDNYILYMHDFLGKTSIKKILPVFAKDDSYSKMTINNGILAVVEFFKSGSLKGDELEKYRKNALDYCIQDTYSMFLILKKLRGLV